MRNQLPPIRRNMLDTKFLRERFSSIAAATGDRNNLRAHTIAKPRDLRGAGKPRPDNSDSNR